MYLTPNEHVFGGQRDLFVSVTDVSTHRFHDLIFWQVNLGIQIRYAELAATSTPRRHFHNAKSSSRVGKQNSLTIQGVLYIDRARELQTFNRLPEKRECVFGFASSLNDTIDA